jgi:hypothetical protein
VYTADEWIEITSVFGAEELTFTVRTNSNVEWKGLVHINMVGTFAYLEAHRGITQSILDFNCVDLCQRRLFCREELEKLINRAILAIQDDLHSTSCVAYPAM